MKQKMLKIQIIQTIFVVILFIIAQLQKNGIINTSESIMPLYIITIFIYWITICIVLIIFMNKNKNEEKKILINGILISIELLLLGIFCGSVDRKIDRTEFLKYCNETVAEIYYVNRDVDRNTGLGVVDGMEYCTTTYTYYLRYYVEGKEYKSKFYTSTQKKSTDQLKARDEAEKVKPEYNIGDEITIYYNTKNPEEWRRDISYASEESFIIIAVIILGLRIFGLTKSIINKKLINNV